MDFEEFETLFREDRHSLSDLIKDGDIPFDLCLEAHGRMNLPPLHLSAMLVHPDCEPFFFKSNFGALLMKVGGMLNTTVIPNTPLMSDLECVQKVMNSKLPTVESIIATFEIYSHKDKVNLLFDNPHLNQDLKMAAYDTTGDLRLVHNDAKEMFLF